MIPAEDKDARNGTYDKGPGMKLIKAINESVGKKNHCRGFGCTYTGG